MEDFNVHCIALGENVVPLNLFVTYICWGVYRVGDFNVHYIASAEDVITLNFVVTVQDVVVFKMLLRSRCCYEC